MSEGEGEAGMARRGPPRVHRSVSLSSGETYILSCSVLGQALDEELACAAVHVIARRHLAHALDHIWRHSSARDGSTARLRLPHSAIQETELRSEP